MKKTFFLYIPVILISFLLLSCGSINTQIIANHPDVEIYINNVYKGKNIVEIPKIGIPQSKTISARYHGIIVGEKRIHRNFEPITAISGCFTYGIGWLVFWRYPDVIYIPIDTEIIEKNPQPKNIWQQPPKNWK